MILVEMPKANENLTEATLDRWLVKAGESVAKDQPLCEIITDKAKFELPATESGVVLVILGIERSVLPVGSVLCVIGAAGESPPAGLAARNDALAAAHRGSTTAVSAGGAVSGPATAVRATPAARRVAKEAGVNLAEVARALNLSGPVNEKDVKAYLERPKA